MTNHTTHANVVLFGLEEKLAFELREALGRFSVGSQSTDLKNSSHTLDSLERENVRIVFCNPDMQTVRTLRAIKPHASIIVISRVPEELDWLDAIEAGADDYYAPPFESMHIRWLLQNHLHAACMAA